MIVQGSGLYTTANEKSGHRTQKRVIPKSSGEKTTSASDSVELSSQGLERSELLRKIQKKIKNGYYNSESVLEDLSYGFAKALDS